MARIWRFVALAALLVLPVAIVFSGGIAESSPSALEITCQIDSVTTGVSAGEVTIPVRVENFTDSIAGVQLWVNIANPELLKFEVIYSSDTLVIPKIDTAGTLLSGFESVTARIRDGEPNLGDTLCVDSLDYNVQILLNKSETKFSNPDNELIGYTCDSLIVDTTFNNCAEFIADSCVNWFDTTIVPHNYCRFDDTKILYTDGVVAWSCGMCGDADGNGAWSIGDAVYIINFIFASGPPPNPISNGDADGNGAISIGDAVFLINFIFAGGPPPGSC